jgi:hypothetical protein
MTKTLAELYRTGIKYAAYDADENPLNLAHNGAESNGKQAFDLNKVCAWAEMKL